MKSKSKLKLKPTLLRDKNGRKVGIVLRSTDFKTLIGELEDGHDVITAQKRTSRPYKTIPLAEVEARLFGHAKK